MKYVGFDILESVSDAKAFQRRYEKMGFIVEVVDIHEFFGKQCIEMEVYEKGEEDA